MSKCCEQKTQVVDVHGFRCDGCGLFLESFTLPAEWVQLRYMTSDAREFCESCVRAALNTKFPEPALGADAAPAGA